MNSSTFMALIVLGFAPSIPAADQSDLRLPLLERLHTEKRAAMLDASRVQAGKPQIDLTPLLGVGRQKLLQFLGAPDICATPTGTGCTHSQRLAYFYYPYQPSTAKDTGHGLVEVTVTAGGGWALELNLSHDSVVRASWVKQE